MKWHDDENIVKQLDELELNSEDIDNQIDKVKEVDRKHRSTFCGTAEYVSPEMLFGEVVGFEADYWALGCIIFKLITGTSPFKEKSQFLVFQNIKTLTIKWPDTIQKSSKDLIVKLLKHKPEERLGSKCFDDIINHDFFKDESGDNIVNSMKLKSIPYVNSLKTKTLLEQEKEAEKNNILKKMPEKKSIQIIKEQIVEKKSPYFHYNTRLLKLDSTPKLEYIDPETNQVKGIIYLSNECEAKVINSGKFELFTRKRSFLFKVGDDEAGVWCKSINDEVSKLGKDPNYDKVVNKEIDSKNSTKKVY